MSLVRATADAYLGLDNPSKDEWDTWHRAMLAERDGAAVIADPSTDWSDDTFRQLFLFMYDASFYDREAQRYRTSEVVSAWRRRFGRIDSVLLWQGYPRLGFDERTQFDFYRDLPGGLAALRSQVVDVFHANGIRVFVDYNPWDAGTYDELGAIVAALDADGVMLDTLTDAPEVLARDVLRRRRGVVFAPELRPRVTDLGRLRQSWSQWAEIGDDSSPSILRNRWLVPRHRQFTIRRWDESRRGDIVYSFFNGSGLLLWDNIFGSWNPYSQADRRLVAETAAVIDRHGDVLTHGEWLPLIPTGVSGLDANRWTLGERSIVTLRNRTKEPLAYRVRTDAPEGSACVAFWGPRERTRPLHAGDEVVVEALGVQAIVIDSHDSAREALAHFDSLAARAAAAEPGYEERAPRPRLSPSSPTPARAGRVGMIELPAGDFEMHIRHERRECGCYPLGATDQVMSGWFYEDPIEHVVKARVSRFAMRASAVTNEDFLAFVKASGYRPKDEEHFLEHVARGVAAPLAPVTFVSLDDARAFAAHYGERLPTELEWQWAAEGAGAGNVYPWGNEGRTFPNHIRPALERETATAHGILGLSGNTWELTESEHTDGHTRFVMLRGGVYLPPGESEWLVARGARPNDSHAKYILLSDGVDRSATLSFRTVVDL